MSSWGATLRIARRDARRAKGRSALVVAMIALPVLGITALDVAARTYELSADQEATRAMGAADVRLSDSGANHVRQYQEGSFEVVGEARARPLDLATLPLPAGSRSLPDLQTGTTFAVPGKRVQADLRELDYTSALARGLYRQQEGRAPVTPNEVAVTDALADRLDVGPGDLLSAEGIDVALEVVGVLADGNDRGLLTAVVGPGGVPTALLPTSDSSARSLLVGLPRPLDEELLRALNDRGVVVDARAELPGAPEPPRDLVKVDQESLTAIVLVAGMALLEIVLLAGPAFAVGTKRQSRELALLAATGGDRRDVRRVVLGGGLVLGAVAGAVGVGGGIALAAASRPILERFDSSVPGPFDVRPLEVGAIALLAVGTALLAALVPSVLAARQDVVAALTGRRGTRRTTRRVPVLGAVAAVVGAMIVLEGARRRDLNAILAGSVVAELGLVALTPVLVGLAGRLGPLLPAAPRLALRDASRNRSRTAPAVSAILAAVAGSVAVGTVLTSLDAKERAEYTPTLRPGMTAVALYDAALTAADVTVARQALVRAVGTTDVRVVRGQADANKGIFLGLETPPGRECTYDAAGLPRTGNPWCADSSSDYTNVLNGYPIGGAAELALLTGEAGPDVARVLAAGGAVVSRQYVDARGTAVLTVETPGECLDATCRQPVPRRIRVPALAYGDDVGNPVPFLSEGAARAVGLPTAVSGLLAPVAATTAQQDRLRSDLSGLDVAAAPFVERGYDSDYGVALYLLVAASALLVLGASGMATGLAAADGRADLATLAAVGASPGTRRRLAASQSVVTAGLGTALGVAAGLVPALGLIGALNSPIGAAGSSVFATGDYPYALPWTNLAITVVVVPLVAGLGALALTRSRLPLVRRAA